jgi:hypothetical protein
MSNRLVKNGMGLVASVEDEVYIELVVSRSGVKLKSPLPPAEVCKLLNNISVDIMFNSFQPAEVPKIQPV